MFAHRLEVTIPSNGKLYLEALPFAMGEKVEIIILKQPARNEKTVFLAPESISKPTIEDSVAALYTSEKITFKQAQHLLNHTNWQDTVAVLEQHGCQLYYDSDDFEEDLETLAAFEKESSS
jgi:predicted HTH domain antitoxin